MTRMQSVTRLGEKRKSAMGIANEFCRSLCQDGEVRNKADGAVGEVLRIRCMPQEHASQLNAFLSFISA